MEAFDKLGLQHKIFLIESEGELIMQVAYFEYTISLYSINKSLVEVYFDSGRNEFVNILSVTYCELEKYVKHVDISGLRL